MTRADNGGGWGVLAGSTVFLMYIAALVPGLLAVLLLTIALALPLLLPAIPLLVLGGLFVALRKLARAISFRLGRRSRAAAQA
jgi:hypothetical protein